MHDTKRSLQAPIQIISSLITEKVTPCRFKTLSKSVEANTYPGVRTPPLGRFSLSEIRVKAHETIMMEVAAYPGS